MIAPVQPTFVLIGAGQISRAYARAFSSSKSLRLSGVADINKSSAEKIASVTGATAWDDIESMCVELEPTAAIICTPPNTQAAIAIELMNLGVHVLCEKPMGLSTMETRRMICAADDNDVQFTMASSYCFDEDIQAARRMIEDGDLGEVILFENTFARRVDMTDHSHALTSWRQSGDSARNNNIHSPFFGIRRMSGAPRERHCFLVSKRRIFNTIRNK